MSKKYSTRTDSDFEFKLGIQNGWTINQIQAAVLADIRRELKKLNENLERHCRRTEEGNRALRSMRQYLYKSVIKRRVRVAQTRPKK